MLEMYQSYTAKPTDTYRTEDHSASYLGWLASRPNLMQQYCRSAKGSGHAKTAVGHFEYAV